ncbi:MAG: ExbD/TolR family protein [Terriglobales bacterium]
MAMSVGKKTGPTSDINITPLIDILLVLIIIFMVITPMTPHGLRALVPQKPKHHKTPPPINNRTIVVQVLDGPGGGPPIVKINQETVTWDTLGPDLENIYKTRAEKVMFVSADNNIEFQQVARAIDIAKGEDPAIQVGLMTQNLGGPQ